MFILMRFCLICPLQYSLPIYFLYPKIQMEHSRLIIEPIVTIYIWHFMTKIFLNYWKFVQI
jgi:hypothetical protein